MKLKLFKTLWGQKHSISDAVEQAVNQCFDGIEGPVPEDDFELKEYADILKKGKLEFIAEITTAGSYVPNRNASFQEHIDDFAKKLEHSLKLDPLFISCLGGCDAWPEEQSIAFFAKAMEFANQAGITVSFETHRGRSFFNPWVTDRIVSALPNIKLTCDYSHWCVVSESLIPTENDVFHRLAKHAYHIHARVGYEQGPQVPHPGAPEYTYALRAHQLWWETIWQEQYRTGRDFTTMTPEFGPDGYLHHEPYTNKPVADLWELNCWMALEEKQHFSNWLNQSFQRATNR